MILVPLIVTSSVSADISTCDPPMAHAPPVPSLVTNTTWNITSVPDLGSYNSPHQQPVDFAVWQAADGSYQLESCIRNTKIGGHGRLFYRWQTPPSPQNDTTNPFFSSNWRPVGISMVANDTFGEDVGGLQAPHVTRWNGIFHKFYGTWSYIAQAISTDGKHFQRVLDADGKSTIFNELGVESNTRDPMLFGVTSSSTTINFHLIYSAYPGGEDAVFARVISARSSNATAALRDTVTWRATRSVRIGFGGVSGTSKYSSECPHLLYHPPSQYFYLFRTQSYVDGGVTRVYASMDPAVFGVGDVADAYLVTELNVCAPEVVMLADGSFYLVSLKPDLDGMRVTKLVFEENAVKSTN
eukprot:m.1642895 g.1642895  ORF g.1642895 m.1642895 type:complete len:355 (+) comp55785_c0_seq1:275-1339(+)